MDLEFAWQDTNDYSAPWVFSRVVDPIDFMSWFFGLWAEFKQKPVVLMNGKLLSPR